MTYHIRAFEISLIIHILLIAAVVSAGSLLDKPCPLLVLSFDIVNSRIKEGNLSAPSSTPLEKQCRIKRSEPLAKRDKEEKKQDEAVVPSPVSNVPVPEPAPQVMGRNVASLSRQETRKTEMTGGDMGAGTAKAQEGKQAAKERYLREHFLYIKDRILKRIVYPNLARRMGWHGNVLTSFVIHVDGTVSDIKILKSSGFEVLDENAVMTIKDVSPFPRPPIAAKIMIPISYRLRPG